MGKVSTQLRIPDDVHAAICRAAERNRRSMNAEIVARLEASLRADDAERAA